ncbi:ROK family protein [Paenibacillus lutrae]|uniref:ROK family protein n=1 Tax=Paenibacillus lutrae TaxID=2078573 RepID=A0A7X3K1P8_9BACL|nr:ROK family protein [Paenibacillus lutrae]MVP02350.1 ROK family protein [Paenibacillus lutrae]
MEREHNPLQEFAIGVDVGGTKIHAGIVGRHGEVFRSVGVPTLAGEEEVLSRIVAAIEKLQAEAAASGEHYPLAGIGIGTAGQVDRSDGSIRYASDLLPGYTGVPLKRLVEERFGLPVRVDNDVNVLVLTEKTIGAAQGAEHMLCLALGTGVGGAVLAEGKLLHGAWGGAGELGHMSVDFHGLPCVCGGIGCLEQYASGTGIAKRMQTRLQALGMEAGSTVDSREVFTRWQAGDSEAAAVMDETFAALGAALSSLIHTFNPEVVVIGGGVAEAGESFFTRVREETSRRCMASFMENVQIVPAHQGNWSGMIGAALQLWEPMQNSAEAGEG